VASIKVPRPRRSVGSISESMRAMAAALGGGESPGRRDGNASPDCWYLPDWDTSQKINGLPSSAVTLRLLPSLRRAHSPGSLFGAQHGTLAVSQGNWGRENAARPSSAEIAGFQGNIRQYRRRGVVPCAREEALDIDVSTERTHGIPPICPAEMETHLDVLYVLCSGWAMLKCPLPGALTGEGSVKGCTRQMRELMSGSCCDLGISRGRLEIIRWTCCVGLEAAIIAHLARKETIPPNHPWYPLQGANLRVYHDQIWRHTSSAKLIPLPHIPLFCLRPKPVVRRAVAIVRLPRHVSVRPVQRRCPALPRIPTRTLVPNVVQG
jgi:hypothetical protein